MIPSQERLRNSIAEACPRLETISGADAARPLADGKWSTKQVIGHLIDSASNNHQRFVRANFSGDLIFPGYDQERWVELGRYAEAPWPSLITLWSELNLQIARVMESTPDEMKTAIRVHHNLHEVAWRAVPVDQPATLGYFMNDYVDHLEHHLGQIL